MQSIHRITLNGARNTIAVSDSRHIVNKPTSSKGKDSRKRIGVNLLNGIGSSIENSRDHNFSPPGTIETVHTTREDNSPSKFKVKQKQSNQIS